jgi:hypothetical protein
MRIFGEKVNDEKEKDARDQIDPQRMHMTGALSLDEFIRQAPGLEKEQPEGLKKARVQVEESVGRIREQRTEGPVIIDRRLAALRAERTRQGGAAILAMSQRRARLSFAPQPFSPGIIAELGGRSVAEDQRRRFIGHRKTDYSAGRSKSNPEAA